MDELLTCSVCCERYCEVERQPVLLPRCGHSFCRPCVTLLVSSSCIICPTCRTDQRIESAHRLPTEFTLLAIIAAQDSAKLDNCQRHDVKLSFWCKTCSQATCGECLFEDHPTHSHDVIRSLTYIKSIKESVQEVGSKFMEALDSREQGYYRTVYGCANTITDALRCVTVLRKDMGEARNLMKGCKVDEVNMTMSTATSLAEAAKYLGLKWNIQDANYNRTKREEKEEEEKRKKKEEEDAKKKEEALKEGQGEAAVKKEEEAAPAKKEMTDEEKERRKERIREKRRKKLLAEKEASEEGKAAGEVASPATADAESVKDVKKKALGIRKSKTLSVFEPLSMDKEITTIKEKIAELDNKERERLEMEELKRIEEIEEEEKIKNIEKELEDNKEETPSLTEKEKTANRENEKEDEEAKKVKEQEEVNKSAEDELERLNTILKKPRSKLARKYLSEFEKTEPETVRVDNRASSVEAKASTRASSVASSSGGAPGATADDAKSETDSGEEKSNGEPETSPAQKDDDPYFGELTLEEKEAKEKALEAQNRDKDGAGGIFEFLKAPLFTVCVEGAEGRLALVKCESKGIHIYCHQFQQLQYDVAVKSTVLQAMIPSKNPIVFLELSVGTRRPKRIYVKLWGHLRRAHNFMALCLGDQGQALLNTKLLQIYNLNEPGERILGGDHEYNSGRGGCGILDDLEWNGDYCTPMNEGLLTAAGSGQHATNSLFLICTRADTSRNFSCPFGEVLEGLEDVRDAISKSVAKEEEIWITECGVVLEPPRL